MANGFPMQEEQKRTSPQTDTATDTKISAGTKVALTVIVVGTIVAGVYLALVLAR
ncbi:MAG: hypothetical protein WC544_01765 [Patescibacteria group bacterium]